MNLPPPELIQPGAEHDLLEELRKETQAVFGFDTETVGIDPRKESAGGARTARIVCWSLACKDRWGRYRRWFGWSSSLASFGPWLETAPLVGHNIWGFDWHMCMNHGIELKGIVADTLHMHRYATNGKTKQHGLKHLMKTMLGIDQPSYTELFSKQKDLGSEERSTIGRSNRDGVPTVLGLASSRLGARELIALDRIAIEYPQRLPTLYEYGSLDALGTLMIYERLHGLV